MPKFSDVVTGARTRRPAKLPLPGAQVDPETHEWVGPTASLDLRPLREDEHIDVLSSALAFAKKKGLEKPEDGDPIYERAKMVHTLAIACIDSDSPKDAPTAYFDGGVEQILASEIMTPEVIGYLYLQQQMLQDEVSPLNADMSPAEFMAAALSTAKGNYSFFVNSRPGIQWSFMRTLAKLHVDSVLSSSPSSESSVPPEKTNESPRPSGPTTRSKKA